jgi:hypothetical protein
LKTRRYVHGVAAGVGQGNLMPTTPAISVEPAAEWRPNNGRSVRSSLRQIAAGRFETGTIAGFNAM